MFSRSCKDRGKQHLHLHERRGSRAQEKVEDLLALPSYSPLLLHASKPHMRRISDETSTFSPGGHVGHHKEIKRHLGNEWGQHQKGTLKPTAGHTSTSSFVYWNCSRFFSSRAFVAFRTSLVSKPLGGSAMPVASITWARRVCMGEKQCECLRPQHPLRTRSHGTSKDHMASQITRPTNAPAQRHPASALRLFLQQGFEPRCHCDNN
jgi:hypothetical protein